MAGQTLNKLVAETLRKIPGWLYFAFQPRQLYPATYALITFLLSQFSALRADDTELGPNISAWLMNTPHSLTDAALIGIPLFVVQLILKRVRSPKAKFVVYQVGILATATLFAIILGLVNDRSSLTVAFGVSRVYLTIAVLSLFAGIVQRRLVKQVARAENALLETERQRSLLLSADEATRREVAAFLHNRVQAGLVVTAMQLKITAAKIGGTEETELNSLIQELEAIRKFDVRAAGQQLSPDFELLDLDEALQDIIRGYKKTMEVHTAIDRGVEGLQPEMTLGIYRICEQAMLNAAIHGAATQCTIRIQREGEHKIVLTVENNGHSVANQREIAGAGSAVVDAWVKKFKGEWSLVNDKNGRVSLTATMHVS